MNMKRKKRKNITNVFFRWIAVCIAFYVLLTLYDQHKEMRNLKQQEAVYQQKIEKAQKEVSELEGQLDNIDSDEYIEKVAREQLKMIKKDEMIFIDLGSSN